MPRQALRRHRLRDPAAIRDAEDHYAIALIGPVRADPQATKRPGFTKADFTINWDTGTMTCPKWCR
ncbi:hypothetical protein GCM10009839_17650 [Catenulispora yoronensis]|uniref:Uncharacterized protein n=1 Tax=Catenulispora yoronensis TaxID=450799 RepID=A0ABN2TV02_9ACTN